MTMDYRVQVLAPAQQKQDCVVVFMGRNSTLLAAAQTIDVASEHRLGKLLKRGDITGKIAESLLLHDIYPLTSPRLLLIGSGHAENLTVTQYHKIIRKITHQLKHTSSQSVCVNLMDIGVPNQSLSWHIQQAIDIIETDYYQFNQFKHDREHHPPQKLQQVWFNLNSNGDLAEAKQAIRQAQAISAGIHLCKDLGNLPGNVCTPTYLADQAQQLAQQYQNTLRAEILEEATLEQLQMGAFLAVSQGSRQPAKLIVLHYAGANSSQKPVVLVGKGVTFDAGGISIKSAAQMDEMKFDMCGGAAVMGLMKLCAELQLPLNVIGVIAATENLPDGNAMKPGDIVTSLSGKTIEILNTDAEGRLVLCDTLTYCERFNPEVVIDIATLTGAVITALGGHASGLLSNDTPLAQDLLQAGEACYDRAWQLPLWDEYQDQLKSNFADMANVGGRPAGTITAACFLARFTKKFRWAHLDIAGTAWLTGNQKGATGRPVALLAHYLLTQANIRH